MAEIKVKLVRSRIGSTPAQRKLLASSVAKRSGRSRTPRPSGASLPKFRTW